MEKKICTWVFIIFIAWSMVGCAGSPVATQGEAGRNRSHLIKLKIGMSKDQVLAIMGDPYKTESYQIEERNIWFWLYLTEGTAGHPFFAQSLNDSNLTPLAFERDVLVGWGRNYYDKILRINQNIVIENQQ